MSLVSVTRRGRSSSVSGPQNPVLRDWGSAIGVAGKEADLPGGGTIRRTARAPPLVSRLAGLRGVAEWAAVELTITRGACDAAGTARCSACRCFFRSGQRARCSVRGQSVADQMP